MSIAIRQLFNSFFRAINRQVMNDIEIAVVWVGVGKQHMLGPLHNGGIGKNARINRNAVDTHAGMSKEGYSGHGNYHRKSSGYLRYVLGVFAHRRLNSAAMNATQWIALGITIILLIACIVICAWMVRWVIKNLK